MAVASGMAAITYAIQCICDVGSNIVSTSQLYGGTYTLFAHMLPAQGIEVRFAEDDSPAALEKLTTPLARREQRTLDLIRALACIGCERKQSEIPRFLPFFARK